MTMGKWPRSRFMGSFAGSIGRLGKAMGVLLAKSKTLLMAPRSPWACWRATAFLASCTRFSGGAGEAGRSAPRLAEEESGVGVGMVAWPPGLIAVAPDEGEA